MKKIPPGWTLTRIGQICEVVRGASPRPAGDPRYFNGDYLPWITVADVTAAYGMYLDKTKSFLTQEGAKFTRTISPDTLILTNSGATLGVPKITKIKAGANDGIAMLLNPVGATNEYLYFVLESRTDYFRNHLAPGNGQPNLNTDLIKEEPLLLPSASEQCRITNVGVLWDTAIRKTERLIAAKERHYTHELSRLISRGQHPRTNVGTFACEVRERNACRAVALAEIATIWKGQQLNRDAMVEDGPYYVLNGGTKPSGRTTDWNCEANTITISEGGNSCGFVSYNSERFWCGGHCYALKDVAEIVNVHYLFHYLKGMQERIMALRVGSGLPNIQKSDLETFPVILPDLSTQSTIARYLNALREEIDLLEKSRDALKRQKRGLMQKLLTGEWRVPPSNAESTDKEPAPC